MSKAPTWLRIPLAALAAAAITFPIASIQWRQDTGEGARIGALCLLIGLVVLWVGMVMAALRRIGGITRPAESATGKSLLSLLLLALQQAAFFTLFLGIEKEYRGPFKAEDLQTGFQLAKVMVLILELICLPAILRWLLLLAGLWKGGEIHRAQIGRLLARRGVAFVLVGLLVLLACLVPFVLDGADVNLALETLIYMTLALGLNVVVGYAGLLVLGYAAFWAIGAYTFALLALRLDVGMWISLPLAGAASMLAGFLIGLPSLRLRGDYLAIVTLGFGEVVYYLLKTEVSVTGGEMGLPNMDIKGSIQEHATFFGHRMVEAEHYYWPALALVLLAVFVIRRVERSRVGRALVAMREDDTAARCMGINTTRLKLTAFAFAAMWAGFAGVLWCAKSDFTNPMFFNFEQSVMILAMVVLGGLGSIPGAIVGTILLYSGPTLLRVWFPEFQDFRLLIFGGLMILLMIYRPQGLFGSARLKIRPGAAEEGAQ